MGRLAASFNRMAESRQEAEETLRDQAHHDPMTKLPNRVLFQIRLGEALDNARRVSRTVAVHCLDLNKFKDVNDTLGHPAGDMLLQQVAERLNECIRKSDTVARIGGDEFAIIQTNLTNNSGIATLAGRVIDSLAMPFDLNDERVYTGTSIGISTYPHDGVRSRYPPQERRSCTLPREAHGPPGRARTIPAVRRGDERRGPDAQVSRA